jgi:hypothetical protein
MVPAEAAAGPRHPTNHVARRHAAATRTGRAPRPAAAGPPPGGATDAVRWAVAPPPLTLLPLMAAWHLRHPRWNVVTVRDALASLEPDAVWTTALPPGYAADPGWRDTDEVALPWTVAGWAERRGTPLTGVGEPAGSDAADFERYLDGYPRARAPLDAARAELRPLLTVLPRALDLAAILREVVPPLAADLRLRSDAFGEGPGTAWRETRARTALGRVTAAAGDLGSRRGALLVEIDLWPSLTALLDAEGLEWGPVTAPPVSDAARRRALLDVAWRGEAADVAGLLGQLRDLDTAEARFLEAQLLLAHDHPAEALEALEQASHGDFSEPYLLPGMLLARLGQLRDLAGRRDRALQAYRGALALAWAPAEAREAAEAGLLEPFGIAAEGPGREGPT